MLITGLLSAHGPEDTNYEPEDMNNEEIERAAKLSVRKSAPLEYYCVIVTPAWCLSLYTTALAAPSTKGRSTAPTCTCVHLPPRAVGTLRSLSFAAMALRLAAPAFSISRMIGSTLAANRLAFAFSAAVPRFAASSSLGLPSRLLKNHFGGHQ